MRTQVEVCVCVCNPVNFRGLLLFLLSCSDDQKEYLMDVGIFADLQAILDNFVSNPRVIAEAFCIIACLSDLSELV